METLTGYRPRELVVTSGRQCWAAANNPAFRPSTTTGKNRVNILHLFGRTHNNPPVYYYRSLDVSTGEWHPWEKVDLDIESDHLIPVVWNRRLYLFWATLEEKPDPNQNLMGVPIPVKTQEELDYEQWEKDHASWEGEHAMWVAARDAWDQMNNLLDEDKDDVFGGPLGSFPIEEPQEPVEPPKPVKVDPTVEPVATQWEITLSWSEYWQGKWSSRQTADTTVISPVFPFEENYFPRKADHFFTPEIDIYGRLFIDCYRRRKQPHHPTYRDDTWFIGRFVGRACREKLSGFSMLNNPGSYTRITPDHSQIDFMEFLYSGGNEKLTLYGPAPSTKPYPIFEQLDTAYHLLPPSDYYEPPDHGFSFHSVMYPFSYDDYTRLYLALPVYDKPPSIQIPWNVFQFSSRSVKVVAEDALVSRIPQFVDLGDPAPLDIYTQWLSREGIGSHILARNLPPRELPYLRRESRWSFLPDFNKNPPPEIPVAQKSGASEDVTVQKDSSMITGDEAITLAGYYPYLKFQTLFHPHVSNFIKELKQQGLSSLLTLENQRQTNDPKNITLFQATYAPTSHVHWDYPEENVDFEGGAYSIYNWELFCFAPLMMACRLSQNQKFEEAQKWFHYIFNPTADSDEGSPQRYWNFLPFFNNAHPTKEQIAVLLRALKDPEAPAKTKQAVKEQITQWRLDSFNPHRIARLRVTAYQKTVVMKYIDNLVAWGDQLFARDSIESINEATQLYILAANILGPRPEKIPPRGKIKDETYEQLRAKLDAFSNALVDLENEFPFASEMGDSLNGDQANGNLGMAKALYFCIPRNEQLLAYWDTIEDRLFKIRNCMNIEGVTRELPLYQPPIDPALLVKAKVLGLDLDSVLNDLSAPMPHYRFRVMNLKAQELCNELKSLGASLLSALEKRDAEELAQLRATQELALLKAARIVRRGFIQEAKDSEIALTRTKETVDARETFYVQLKQGGLNLSEKNQLTELEVANNKRIEAANTEKMARSMSKIPNTTSGTSGMSSPVIIMHIGGQFFAEAARMFAGNYSEQSASASHRASRAGIEGGYARRAVEWDFQEKQANRESKQLAMQIAAQQIRVAINEKELDNHELQIENSKAVESFLRSKFTDQELYNWHVSQISTVYFQTYKLAYETAKRAEKAYRYELGLTSSNFIQFGSWDSLRKGLLSGERLQLDLKRMEMAYLNQNRREYEISKQISLIQLDSLALITLKEAGSCEVELPEALFDMDFPGHYMRRIKNVRLSIPCVTGPYTSVNCTLTLLRSKVRMDPTAQRPYREETEAEDDRFQTFFGARTSIATSHARDDHGLFELSLQDERYLPFEGSGVISRWRIELPQATNAFEFNTISDVILNMNYTAREGGEILRIKALEAAQGFEPTKQSPMTQLSLPKQMGWVRLFTIRHEFPNHWHRFLHPNDEDTAHVLKLDLTYERFPFQFRGRQIKINAAELLWKLERQTENEVVEFTPGDNLNYALKPPQGPNFPSDETQGFKLDIDINSPFAGIPRAKAFGDENQEKISEWTLTIEESAVQNLSSNNSLRQVVTINAIDRYRLNPAAIHDLWVVITYSVM